MSILSEINEHQLITGYQNGDLKCFSELYKRYCQMLFNVIYRFVNNRREAEDLLQDCFVSIHTELQKGIIIESFGGWAKRIAINKAISFLRKRKLFYEEMSEQHFEVANIDTELDDMTSLKIDAIKAAILQLPIISRTIVNLYLLDGIPQEEIAQIIGMQHNAVRTSYHRAKNQIIKILNRGGGNESKI